MQKQIYSNWEAIFVNDGSVDHTNTILTRLTTVDKRVMLIEQPNQGAAKARELGISKATGEYITFLDVDDTLPVDALETMVGAFDVNVDIVVSGFNIEKQGKNVKCKTLKEQKLDSIAYLKGVLCGKYGWELCAKMYRRELFSQPIETPIGIRIGEDAAVFIQLVVRARQVNVLAKQLYNYIQYEQSASHLKLLEYAEETLEAAFFIEALLKKTSIYKEVKKEIDAMFLLFYSNSSRKVLLSSKHPLVYKMAKEHFKLSTFIQVPLLKSVYVNICYIISHFV